MRVRVLLGTLLPGLVAFAAYGALPTPEAPTATLQPLVGEPSSDLVEPGDTLLDVAFRHRLGFQALQRLNPDVDVWIPDPGTVVRLPTQAILPDAPHEGLVVNVPEMRLYDYTAADPPEVFSVAVGDAQDPTVLGSFRIGARRTHPAWTVPESIRREKPELPAVVAPGPDNPLGSRWLTIGQTTYGIHGTNNRWSIGREATHGCVRLYEDEMERLYDRVPSGTPVRLVYEPVKWGTDGERLYVEVHPDLYGRVDDAWAAAYRTLRSWWLEDSVDPVALARALREARGVPVAVGRLPASGGGAPREAGPSPAPEAAAPGTACATSARPC